MYRKISVTATASIVTILLGAVNNKIIAFFGGPSGLALFGSLKSSSRHKVLGYGVHIPGNVFPSDL